MTTRLGVAGGRGGSLQRRPLEIRVAVPSFLHCHRTQHSADGLCQGDGRPSSENRLEGLWALVWAPHLWSRSSLSASDFVTNVFVRVCSLGLTVSFKTLC